MSVIALCHLKQKLSQKTRRCFLHDREFLVTSMKKETVLGFNFFVYVKKYVPYNPIMSEQCPDITV